MTTFGMAILGHLGPKLAPKTPQVEPFWGRMVPVGGLRGWSEVKETIVRFVPSPREPFLGWLGVPFLGLTGALLGPLGVPWGPKRVPGAISGAFGPTVCALGDSKGPKKRKAENL